MSPKSALRFWDNDVHESKKPALAGQPGNAAEQGGEPMRRKTMKTMIAGLALAASLCGT
jgi:hypothetical protein